MNDSFMSRTSPLLSAAHHKQKNSLQHTHSSENNICSTSFHLTGKCLNNQHGLRRIYVLEKRPLFAKCSLYGESHMTLHEYLAQLARQQRLIRYKYLKHLVYFISQFVLNLRACYEYFTVFIFNIKVSVVRSYVRSLFSSYQQRNQLSQLLILIGGTS